MKYFEISTYLSCAKRYLEKFFFFFHLNINHKRRESELSDVACGSIYNESEGAQYSSLSRDSFSSAIVLATL